MRILTIAACETPLYAIPARTEANVPDDIAEAFIAAGLAKHAPTEAPVPVATVSKRRKHA